MSGHGKAHELSDAVDRVLNPPEPDLLVTTLGPGGQDPIRLTRSATSIGKDVEFLSATLLPGRGMNVFQITAMIPGHGEVPLLVSPAVDTVASQLTDKGADAHGEASMTMGGAFELPWAGRVNGQPGTTPGALEASWQGSLLHFPALASDETASVDGLFLDRSSTSVKSDVLPDGQYAQAVFTPAFKDAWPSTIAVTATVELSAHTLDLTLSATNTGKNPAPLGMGWHPIFAIPSGNRADELLKLPSKTVLATNHTTGLPTGKSVSVDGSPLDFSRGDGSKLSTQDLDATYVQLQPGDASPQPVAEMRDTAYNISVRVIPMSANITNLHVVAPADKKWVSITPATNMPDAFGAEWKPGDGGMMTLAPGATVEWKVRVEVSPVVGIEDRTH
jgi:hypothetical protein